MTKKIVIYIVWVGLAMMCYSCGNKKMDVTEENGGIQQAFLENVTTVKVVMSYQEQEIILTGKVEYNPDKIISYVPLISGIIDRAHFSLGEKVQQGQALLDVRSTDLNALIAERISLEADEQVAARELRTAQSMFAGNMLSESELLEVTGKLKQIRTAIDKLKSDMNVYGTDKGNGLFTIHAPMSGYVVHKKASPGSMISPEGDEVFTIADLSTVWVTSNVYANHLLFVREGMDVEMTTFSYPHEIFYGKIDFLSQVFDPEERVLKARTVMDNKDLKLKPEMSIVVTVKDKSSQQLATIPSDALIFDENRYYVVVEETVGNFVIRDVERQGQNNTLSYISSGLSEGEQVVVKNQLLIYSRLKEE